MTRRKFLATIPGVLAAPHPKRIAGLGYTAYSSAVFRNHLIHKEISWSGPAKMILFKRPSP